MALHAGRNASEETKAKARTNSPATIKKAAEKRWETMKGKMEIATRERQLEEGGIR